MKKMIITAAMALCCAATVVYTQGTASSTDTSGTTKASAQGMKAAKQGNVQKSVDIEDNNSMLFSREAIAIRRKNLTEPDVTVKAGSGSAEKNTKNHTGTTGNYRNLATQTSGIPSRE